MTYEEQEKLRELFEKHNDYDHPDRVKFEDLEVKPFECEQVCAVMFLYEKLLPKEKKDKYLFHGEHDTLYIGSSFDIFEPFTEEEVKRAVTFGISVADDGYGDGFEIYASM